MHDFEEEQCLGRPTSMGGAPGPKTGSGLTMKLCLNCESGNPLDAVFCTECGMSLMRAPIGEEAIERLKERREAMEGAPLFTLPSAWYRVQVDDRSRDRGERDDEGRLEVAQEKITFKGQHLTVEIDAANIVGLDLIEEVLTLRTILGFFAFFAFVLAAIYISGEFGVIDTLFIVIVFVMPVTLSLRRRKWIRIQYENDDEEHRLTVAYLADGSAAGIPGLFGDSKKVYEHLSSWLGAYYLHGTKP